MAHDGVDITPLDMPDMKFGAKSAPLRSPSRIIPFLFGRRLTLHITSHELSVSGPSLHCEAIIMAPRATIHRVWTLCRCVISPDASTNAWSPPGAAGYRAKKPGIDAPGETIVGTNMSSMEFSA